MPTVTIHHLYRSPGHNFFGHHGKPAGETPIEECDQLELVAGSGIVGDRFFDYKPDYKGQITFFDHDLHRQLADKFHLPELAPSAYRRNVLISGIDLNSLIGKTFTIVDIKFAGHSECTPCYWMDQACAPGSEEFLKERGGLRARIREGGTILPGIHELIIH